MVGMIGSGNLGFVGIRLPAFSRSARCVDSFCVDGLRLALLMWMEAVATGSNMH